MNCCVDPIPTVTVAGVTAMQTSCGADDEFDPPHAASAAITPNRIAVAIDLDPKRAPRMQQAARTRVTSRLQYGSGCAGCFAVQDRQKRNCRVSLTTSTASLDAYDGNVHVPRDNMAEAQLFHDALTDR